MQEIIILALTGLAAGALSGLLGVGGGIILVPSLVFFLGLSQHLAQGTTLAMLALPLGFSAVKKYYKAGHVQMQWVFLLMIGFVVGNFLGAFFSLSLNDKILQKAFGVFLLLIAGKSAWELKNK